MALFKISKGMKASLPSAKTAGYCWYTIDDSLFYIDYEDENGVAQRQALNAKDAETLCGESLENILAAIESASSRVSTIDLDANNWSATSSYWSQNVTINSITSKTKVDLQPTAIQIAELQDSGIALVAENDSGNVTVYAFGEKPSVDYTMQVTLTEVVPV